MLAASAGERLRTLRALLGFKQTELAKVSGVSQAWISDAERGLTEPTEAKLRAVADATGTPYGFFNAKPSSIPLDSLRFRKLASASQIAKNRIHAFYGESHRVVEQMFSELKYPSPPLPYAPADLHDLCNTEIDELAAATREALRLAPDAPIPHLTRALERAGVAVAPIALPDPAGEDHTATTGHFGVSHLTGVGEVALIGYFPGQYGDRDRFTLAHEVGHMVLHSFRRPPPSVAEQEANRFACALLVPYERATEHLSDRLGLNDLARLKATWGVSIQALIMRGSAVGTISDTRKRSLFVQLSQRGWRKNEPVTVHREEPLLLWKLLARRHGPRPYRAAAESLAIPPAVLRSIAPTPTAERPARTRSTVRTLQR